MKFNFKKISAVAISTLLTGMTMGVAAAASYPAPFVSGGVANTAIVYGTGQGVSDLDRIYGGNIQTDLQKYITSTGSTTTTVEGGDSVLIEKASTKWQLGKGLLQVRSTSLDDNDMETLLADGKFVDDDNDEFDYKQNIVLANSTLTQFDDDEYQRDTPTLGVRIADGAHVLNYTFDLTEEPYFTDLETSTIPIMGKGYYVLDAATTNTSITLLDSAEEATLSEGETQTLTVGDKSYEVSVEFISDTETKLNVNGASTNSLNEKETQKLADGAYVGVKDIMYTSKETGTSKVEFSIGKGKLVLNNDDEVQMNDEDIDNLKSFITGNTALTKLSGITLEWKADGDLFIADGSEAVMPGFGNVKLSFGGMTFPAEETIILKADGDDNFVLQDFPLKDVTETIYLFYSNSTNFTEVGKDSNNRLATRMIDSNTLNFTEGTDDYAVVSYKSGDDAESYLVRATNFDDSTYPDNEVDIEYKSGSTWKSLDSNVRATETVSIGSIDFTVDAISNESSKTVQLSVSTNNYFNKLYSEEGLEVTLPWINETARDLGVAGTNYTNYTIVQACTIAIDAFAEGQIGAHQVVNFTAAGDWGAGINQTTCDSYPATYNLVFKEEDKDDAIALGGNVNVTLGLDTDSEVKISSYTNADVNENAISAAEIGNTDVYVDYVSSALATKILDDQSGDHETMTLVYHGGESYGKVYVTDVSATIISDGAAAGVVMVTDAEVSSVSSKNLIIVGGSCINSAAANVLGGAYCGAAFTANTGVGSGQYLIQGFDGAYASGKLALVVAGYDSADTVNAATYLINKKPDTSKKTTGSTATEATSVTVTA